MSDHPNLISNFNLPTDHAIRWALLSRFSRLVRPWLWAPPRLNNSPTRHSTETYSHRIGQRSRWSFSLLGPVASISSNHIQHHLILSCTSYSLFSVAAKTIQVKLSKNDSDSDFDSVRSPLLLSLRPSIVSPRSPPVSFHRTQNLQIQNPH